MQKTRIARYFSALLVVLLCGSAHAFTFLGVTVGEVSSPARITALLGATCGETHDFGVQVCRVFKAVEEQPAEIYVVLGRDSKVQRIQVHFESGRSDRVENQLLHIYGKPVSSSEAIWWSSLGRHRLYVWKEPDGTEARYFRLSGPFGRAALYISTKADQERLQPKTPTSAPNPSIEGTSTSKLRLLGAAPHVKR